MATLHVRNVPEDIYDRLRGRAERERRSINAEAIEVLREGLSPTGTLTAAEFLERARKDRPRISEGAPSAVELIREDRER